MDDSGFEQLKPWLKARERLSVGPFSASSTGRTRGRAWYASAARAALGRRAARAGVRRRFAPRQLRHSHAIELAREGVPLNVIQRQLGTASSASAQARPPGRHEPADTADRVRHERGSEAHASTQVQRRLSGELIEGGSGIKGQECLGPPAAFTSGIEDVVAQGYEQRDRRAWPLAQRRFRATSRCARPPSRANCWRVRTGTAGASRCGSRRTSGELEAPSNPASRSSSPAGLGR